MLGTLDHGDDLGFYFVATDPDHRGRGLASRLISVAIGEARDRGLRTTSLQSSAMGRPVYERLGYGADFKIRMYERRRELLGRRARRGGRGAHRARALRRGRGAGARAAPGLQRILLQALEAGGWFAEPHESALASALALDDEEERLPALRTLLAEEARMGMMVGVAVGWALAAELREE